jgi:hypothetical protein
MFFLILLLAKIIATDSFVWPLRCLFFDLRLLVTPLVSSNFPCSSRVFRIKKKQYSLTTLWILSPDIVSMPQSLNVFYNITFGKNYLLPIRPFCELVFLKNATTCVSTKYHRTVRYRHTVYYTSSCTVDISFNALPSSSLIILSRIYKYALLTSVFLSVKLYVVLSVHQYIIYIRISFK